MKIYQTKDFYLTALLICNNFELVGSDKRENGVYFHLKHDNDEQLKVLINQFVNFEATVNLGKLVKTQTILRKELDKHRNK